MLKGLYFILISTLAASLFYVFFGIALGYEPPFFMLRLLPVFLGAHVILSIAVYAVSLRGESRKMREGIASRVRRTILILVSALILSALFPASAVVGLYPVQMAVFHLLILFYAGISLGAVSLSGALYLSRDGINLSLLNKYVFTFAVLISLGISYMTVYVFGLLPVS
jgi:hypothetical protein